MLEDKVSEIHAEALYQKQREIEMRNLNGIVFYLKNNNSFLFIILKKHHFIS